ncbi:hypothetical protein [Marinobacter bohaiensis]|uniref:hypothetical protein n=1 Tax=Marinobacter bohaiensis TaxID=2201898 RepID=UPI0013A6925D|nr:hypothetical protein [Marinobacter bohaiensis]
MTSTGNLKLFLLSSIDYRSHDGQGPQYVDAMLSMSRHFGTDTYGAHRTLEGHNVFYSETDDIADACQVTAFEAIDKARGLKLSHVASFNGDPARLTTPRIDAVGVRDVRSHLLYDSHACFLVITEVCLETTAPPPTGIIENIFRQRSSFRNLGIEQYMDDVFKRATADVIQILGTPPGAGGSFSGEDIGFSEEKTLPLLMSGHAFDINPTHFANEETVGQITDGQSMSQDYPGSFFHPGWNYTIAVGFPFEVLVNILHMMIRAQTFFFSLGYMKSYFADELNMTLRRKAGIGEKEVDDAEEVRLAFYDLLAKFKGYKNRLFPKYHRELTALMERWHCNDDVAYVKDSIELNLQAKDRIHNNKVEKQNERQNTALAFIAFLQLISIYGAFGDGFSLFNNESTLFHVGTATLILSLVTFLVISRYLKSALVFGFASALTVSVVVQLGLMG